MPMRLTVHHPKVNVPVLWWRSVGSTHTAFVMETLHRRDRARDEAGPGGLPHEAVRRQAPAPPAALQLAVDQVGYGKKKLPAAAPGAWRCTSRSTRWWPTWSRPRCRTARPCCTA